MLAMGEEVEHESLLWNEEQSWAFPNLATAQEDKSASMMSDSAKDKEAPPPPPAKGKKRSAAAAAGESEDNELHIWTERERRKKMRNMFSNLHALLPHIPPKADKSTIVDEAVKHIKKLQQTVQELEKQKMGVGVTRSHNKLMTVQSSIELAFAAEGPSPVYWGPEFPAVFKTWTSPNVILNICGRDAQMSVCSIRKPGLLTALCFVMEKNNLELVSAQASSDRATCIYMIHARLANGGLDQLQHAFPIEEIFKQAAAEIMMFVNS